MRHGSANLDVLRSIAVSLVVISHLLIEHVGHGEGIYSTQILGTLGVLIFFVHTCLVLMLSLERQAMKDRQDPGTIPFLVARAFRIYPLSIVVVSVVVFIDWASASGHHGGWAVLSNLLLIQNITGHESVPPVLWSLPFELQMYLFLPTLYLFVSMSGRFARYGIGLLWIGMVVVILAVWRLGWDYSLIMFFPCFIPGVLAYSLRDATKQLAPGLLFAFVGTMAIAYPWIVGHGVKATMLSWPICLALGIMIPYCREIESVKLAKLGEIVARYSFGIYLTHVPMINFSFHFLHKQPAVISWIVFFVGTGALSFLAYHLIEKPCTDFGKALSERMKSHQLQAKSNIS
ncbi:peptidoglycan/LPS O-acetylase OafA/YrhL [Paucimonas lemoignei]|uniref:Peptidoglycan/LPS O-acetylase OafA/YrhL n=2 Tax=Paucimonas lemoignei TaxID=29443 RepID=A0A4R3HV45_PAULE|nr:peptidoglycan/LPS O-acetylase OafA/YrhL [Paucimonas lemoignei]